ncbi:thioesterase II family protein [Micromonospora sp. DT31]|uniref:thioesterase II family protein n=1 Tax=Micromonospora sp. DT31 TaxID=3393434 RepID=UPI003CF9FD6F
MTRPVPRPDAAFRLFCIPYAGAGATAFRGWPDQLGELVDVEVLPICPPGREHRLAEPPQFDIGGLTDGVEDWLDRPYGLYGHSVGARLVFELARELRRRGRRPPALLAVSGCPAPQLPVPTPEDSDLDDVAFLRRVVALGALPDVVLHDAELRELVLPPLRADFRYVDSYRYQPEPPLDVLLHALGGDRDPEATVESVRAWQAQTSGAFRCSIVPGDHFFLHSAAPRVHAELAASIAECLVRR